MRTNFSYQQQHELIVKHNVKFTFMLNYEYHHYSTENTVIKVSHMFVVSKTTASKQQQHELIVKHNVKFTFMLNYEYHH
jgi:hypothetical protein